MKKIIYTALIILIADTMTYARYIKGVNWADSVVSYTDKIQSYMDGGCGETGTHYMQVDTPATTWWVLGYSDVDGNGNMYAWDFEDDDRDYAAGWRSSGISNAGQEFIVKFEIGLEDIAGDDLVIRMFCGPLAVASVWASVDSVEFVQIGTIEGALNAIPGEGGYLYDAHFDFNGAFSGDVHFVKVYREIVTSQSGMFFDSFGSACIELPTVCNEVGLFSWALAGDTNGDAYVNFEDFAVMANYWQKCNDPQAADFDISLFADADSIPSNCHGVWQAGMGMDADVNKDCRVNLLDVLMFTEKYLQCNNPEDSNCIVNW